MSDHPRLTEMGIQHPEQIRSYAVNSLNRIDNLRITYKRDKGSLLPVSRSYEFPRIQQGGPDKQAGTVLATSPVLKEIESELDDLLSDRKQKKCTAKTVRKELLALENDVAMRLAQIREMIDELDDD